MSGDRIAISVKGALLEVPATTAHGRTVISEGGLLRRASLYDEEWLEGEAVTNLEEFTNTLRKWSIKPDLFSFARKLPDTKVRFRCPFEWDNIAAIPITTFSDWWEKQVSHDLRKDVKRAEKRGLVIRRAEFGDELVRGIKDIYDESPIRQGRKFWHYGKSLADVSAENSTYLERSEFIGAYCGEELVGFLKIVYVDGVGRMMQILAKSSHQDKRPMNALIAKAVEVCADRRCGYLTYGNYTYGNKTKDSVVDFKRRNGFEKIIFPRYFVPLTLKGRLALRTRLHLGVRSLLPAALMSALLRIRAQVLEARERKINGERVEGQPSSAEIS